ncbi:MAG: Na/Pi cotransporter family protein [Alphaproteobacteria bacterium]|nr:Na/Pi cotransporter family protein [Alphaproteobacteria bacterium]
MNGTTILLHILGGAALLLWGLRMVRTGITRAYGAGLRRAVGAGLANPATALLAGLGATLVLQSSTATSLMVSSFAGKGLVSAGPALATMLGADLGTSLVAQALSFKITWLWPLLVLAGFIAFSVGSSTRLHDLGRVAIGLGLVLLALSSIVSATEPLRGSTTMMEVLHGMQGDPLMGVLIAGVLTMLAYSSLAVILLVVSLTAAGLVPVPFALALVLGANLGAGLLPVFTTLRSDAAARRVPLGNAIFRVVGVVIALPLLPYLPGLLASIESDPARLAVNFHSLFNLGLCVVFIGLIGPVARLCERILPDKPLEADQRRPRHLDPSALDMPTVALSCAARETMRMADAIETMLKRTIEAFESDDRKLTAEIERSDDIVDSLHEAIKLYLTKLSGETMDDEQRKRCIETIAFTTNLEHIGDIIDKNLMELATKKIKRQMRFSTEGAAEIRDMHARLVDNLRLSMGVFMSGDLKMARRLLQEKEQFRDLERAASENHFNRLRAGRVESMESSALHLDIIRDFKRINSHITSVAYPILEQAGELRASRLVAERHRRDVPGKGSEPETREATLSAGTPARG